MSGYMQQPYMYRAPAQYNQYDPYDGFDPKAFTRASYLAALPKPKPKGPLIDFNKHPDSWVVPAEKKVEKIKTMSPNTKRNIIIVRSIQFALRLIELLGALGILAATIMIRHTSSTEGPLIRIPPCADIITTGYAVIHLLSPVKRRTPASAASYHFFALVIDGGLVPFYAIIATVVKSTYEKPMRMDSRWTSLLKAPWKTDKVIYSLMLATVVQAGLHAATFLVSLWLSWMFRRISNLPPDMNPLEENLTSRKKAKHKHKNSELTISHFPDRTDKKTTLEYTPRSSPKKEMPMEEKPLSFFATRNKTNDVYSSPYQAVSNDSTASLPPVYQQPHSARTSRINLNGEPDAVSDVSKSHSKISHTFMSEPSSHLPTINGSAVSDNSAPPVPRKSSKRHSLNSNNWVICEDDRKDLAVSIVDENEEFTGSEPSSYANSIQSSHLGGDLDFSSIKRHSTYETVSQDDYSRHQSLVSTRTSRPGLSLQPLAMNPPTPPPMSSNYPRRPRPHSDLPPSTSTYYAPRVNPLSTTSGNSSASLPASTPPKQQRKFYGDLGSAVQGIRSSSPSPAAPSPPNRTQEALLGTTGRFFGGADATDRYGGISKKDWAAPLGRDSARDGKGRVVSRTGAEYDDVKLDATDGDLGLATPGLRGRNVSGKVVEEGRGGAWWKR